MIKRRNPLVARFLLGLISLSAFFIFSSSKNAPQQHLMLHFGSFVNGKMLQLDTATYINQSGQKYTVTNFKYYISNIKLTDDNGKVYENKNGYYLIREDDPASKDIELADIPLGNYKSISFMIGVDSLHNCSGAQSGALDPINGMFWTWNTGYIFFKLEGKSTASKQPGHIFEYHIGGYKEPTNFTRTVSIDLKGPSDEPMIMELDKTGKPDAKKKMTDIYIGADVSKVMDSKNTIDISKLSSVTDFRNADKIADNYIKMFSLGQLRYGYE